MALDGAIAMTVVRLIGEHHTSQRPTVLTIGDEEAARAARASSRLSMRAISLPNGSASRPQSRMIRCLFGKAPAICRTRGGELSGGRGRVLDVTPNLHAQDKRRSATARS